MALTSRPSSSRTARAIGRRGFLKAAGATATVVAATAASISACSTDAKPMGYVGDPRTLPIPPLAKGRTELSRTVFDLAAQSGETEIVPGKITKTWGFNGPFLGPRVRLHRGEAVKVNIINELDEMTTVHFHGMRLKAEMDGGPHVPIEPGQRWSPYWQVDQPASTLWYHPHPHGKTELHAYRGLAGLILVEDDNEVGLPKEYGEDDIPLILGDYKFTADGQLDTTVDGDAGLRGNVPTVNGITNAKFTAQTKLVRFRILNASAMRLFHLAFSDDRSFEIVASDAGLLHEPVEARSVLLTPGERAEIVVEVQPGEETKLREVAPRGHLGLGHGAPDFGQKDEFDLLTIIGGANEKVEENIKAGLPSSVPGVLAKAEDSPDLAPDLAQAVQRKFTLKGFQINGKSMDLKRLDMVVHPDRYEVWTVRNDDKDWLHNFHIHGVAFQVIDYSGNDQTLRDGWKDTVALPPGAEATLAMKFPKHTSDIWPYMYHCHQLYHEDQGMMGQFVVVSDTAAQPDAQRPLEIDPSTNAGFAETPVPGENASAASSGDASS